MQHDSTDSIPKKNDQIESEVPSTNDLDDESTDSLEMSGNSVVMRERYFDAKDERTFCDWIATNIPIELEIGAGKGLFLTKEATANPHRRYVGLELAGKYAIDCQAKVDKLGMNNIRFFACDAVAVINQDVPDSALDAVHVYFPDPWWKSRHKKRRVLSEQTLCNIQRTLKPNGEFHFWTDVLDYYEATLELVDQVTKLKGPYFVSEPPCEHDMDYRTHFERRTRQNGLPVYRARFVKST